MMSDFDAINSKRLRLELTLFVGIRDLIKDGHIEKAVFVLDSAIRSHRELLKSYGATENLS